MSMTTSPFGTPMATEAPAALQPLADEQPQSSKRTGIILAVVAGALAIGAGAYFLLFAGGDPIAASAPVPPRAPTATAPAPAPVPAPAIPRDARKARNPFVPLVVPASAVAAPAAGAVAPAVTGATPTTVTGTATGTTPGGTVTGTTPGGTVTGTVPLPAPAPVVTKPLVSAKPVAVTVLAVDFAKGTASVKVNRNTYKTAIGDTFAQYFKLVGVTKGTCAYVQYGDVALPMCVGEALNLQ